MSDKKIVYLPVQPEISRTYTVKNTGAEDIIVVDPNAQNHIIKSGEQKTFGKYHKV